MSLGFIAALKELSQAYQPLMLVEINFNDRVVNPTILRLASHMLNASVDGGGGFAYNGNDYYPRLLNTNISAVQALSDQGIDRTPSVTIKIADPDTTIWSAFEQNIGFKGATMTIRFIFWQAGTSNFSTDSYVTFVGTCQQGSRPDDVSTSVTANSKLQMNQIGLPNVHVQPICPWTYPQSPAQRQDGADNTFSPYYQCGYSPDAAGANAVGNYQGSTTLNGAITNVQTTLTVSSIPSSLPAVPFPAVLNPASGAGNYEVVIVTGGTGGTVWTIVRGAQGTSTAANQGLPFGNGTSFVVPYPTCPRDRASCMLRNGKVADTSLAADGNITKDNSNRATGRFGGIQWQPAASVKSRGYISGKWELIVNNSNQAKYGDLVPIMYGTGWIDPLVLNVYGDANYTVCEVLLCQGQINWVYKVVYNGIAIPQTNNDAYMGSKSSTGQINGNQIGGGYWSTINDGRRNGAPNADWGKSKGDPYGSLAVLEIVVPKQVQSASGTPSIQIWFDGPAVRKYWSVTTISVAAGVATATYTGSSEFNVVGQAIGITGTGATDGLYTIATSTPGSHQFTFSTGAANGTYGPGYVYSSVFTDYPGWPLMDVLFRSGWKDSEIDVGSFVVADADNTQINFTNRAGNIVNTIEDLKNGGTKAYLKYSISLPVRQRVSASDLLRQIRNNARLILRPNKAGLISVLVKSTLASQQSSLPTLNGQTATNYTTGISGINEDGSNGTGFVAYAFDESNIAEVDSAR